MATICKIEKMVRIDNNPKLNVADRYPNIQVWAVLDDEGHTIFETEGAGDCHFKQCREWLEKNPQPLVACLTCQE